MSTQLLDTLRQSVKLLITQSSVYTVYDITGTEILLFILILLYCPRVQCSILVANKIMNTDTNELLKVSHIYLNRSPIELLYKSSIIIIIIFFF
jgi:hypothetical protein